MSASHVAVVFAAQQDGTREWDDALVITGRRYELERALEDAMPCRLCGATPNEQCQTKNRKPARYPHGCRWQDAQEGLARLLANAKVGDPL